MHRTIQIEITDLCNNDCYYCVKKQDPLLGCFFPYHKIDALFNEILALDGYKRIRLTGGEPFVAPEIIRRFVDLYCATSNATITLELHTNLVVDKTFLKEMLDKLQAANKFISFLVSIQSYDSKTYDRITRSQNHHTTVIQNLHLLSKYSNIYVAAHIVMSKDNVSSFEDLKKTIMLIRSTGIKNIRLNSLKQTNNAPSYRDVLFTIPEILELYQYVFTLQKELDVKILVSYQSALPCSLSKHDFEKYKEVLETLYKHHSYICKAGENVLCIMANGDVKPCSTVDSSFCEANVFVDSLQHILDTKFATFKKLPTPSKCLKCTHYKIHCNGGCKFTEYKLSLGC